MTEIEAINRLRYRIDTASEIVGTGDNAFEDMEMGIKAIEKQIPKKPIINGSLACKCPTCESIEIEIIYENGSEVMCKHCPDCGQKLDWANAYADFKDDIDDIAEQMKEV